jgi:hypothetical protein
MPPLSPRPGQLLPPLSLGPGQLVPPLSEKLGQPAPLAARIGSYIFAYEEMNWLLRATAVLPIALFLRYIVIPAQDAKAIPWIVWSESIQQPFDSQFLPQMNLTFQRIGESISDVCICVERVKGAGTLQIMHRLRRKTRDLDQDISVVISAGITDLSDMGFADIYTCRKEVPNSIYFSFNASCNQTGGQATRDPYREPSCTKNLLSNEGLPENLRCRILTSCVDSSHILEVSATYDNSSFFGATVYNTVNFYANEPFVLKGCPNDYCSIGNS